MVGHAVDGDGFPAVDRAGRDREADPGHDVRVEPGRALGERDLLGPDGVAGAGRRQRVGHDVQHRALVRRGRRCWRGRGRIGRLRAPGSSISISAWNVAAEPGGAPAGGAVERADRVGQPPLPVGQPRRQPGPGRVVVRDPGERRPRDSRLVHGEAEGGQPGRARFQRGERAAAVARAPQRGGPAVRSGDGKPAAQRCGQRPPGERHRAHRVVGHVPQHHGCGEYDGARRRLYGHEGRCYRQLAVDHGAP